MATVGRIVGAAAAITGIALGGWVGVGIALAGGALQYISRRRPGDIADRQQAIRLQSSGNDEALPLVYGETIVGGKVLDIRNDPDDRDSVAVVVAFNIAGEDGGGCGDISEIYFNDVLAISAPVYESEPVTGASIQAPWRPSGGGTYGIDQFLQYGLHRGADAQVVDAHLDSKFSAYDATHAGVGIQYGVFWLARNDEAFPGGIPEITARVRGVQVLDPRDASTDWPNGQNPILAAYDLLLSDRYGLGLSAADVVSASVTSEANYCEELVSIPGGTQQRYTLNGWLDTEAEPKSNLERILSTCRGRLVEEGGQYRFIIKRVQAAEPFELTEENIVGLSNFWRGGTRAAPNLMGVVYVDADRDHQPDEVHFPAAGVANGFLTADNGQLNDSQIELPMCTDRYQAEQTVQTVLKEARGDAGCVLTALRAALQLAHGDVVNVTHTTPGWTQKPFWVEAIGLLPDTGEVQILLREYDAAAYTLDALATKDVPPGTDHPNPFILANTVAILGEDARSIGAIGTGSSGIQAWERELLLSIGAACRSINVVYSFVRPHTAADQPPASTTFDRDYNTNVTPGDEFLTHVLENGAAAAQAFFAQDNAGTTILDSSFFVTVTPYNATGGTGGSGVPGTSRSTQTRSLWDYDSVGMRVVESGGQMLPMRDVVLDATLPVTWNPDGTVGMGAAGGVPGPHTHPASDVVSGTLDNDRISQASVTQHQAALALAASQIAAGVFAAGDFRFPSDLNVVDRLAVGTTTIPPDLVAGDILANGGVLAISDVGVSNIDHIWHDDSGNIWHMVSDAARKALGNARLRLGAGSAASPALQVGSTNAGIALVGGRLSFIVGGIVRASLDSSGNFIAEGDIEQDGAA